MKASEFDEELKKIELETWDKVSSLVFKARNDELIEGQDDNKPVSFADDPNWQRRADALGELCGWIYDRLHGKTRLDRGSMTKKIRKAIGYTYP